jgi:alkylation response protein AidB-like acyl-CoA dehydrogenase
VTVRPLIKITGQTGFNEVLFEDVVVPDALRVDAVGKGWQVAMTTLTHERGAAESAGSGGGISLEDRMAALIALAKKMKRNGRPAWDDAVIRDRIAQLAVRVEGFRQAFRRTRVAALTDHPLRIRCRRNSCSARSPRHRRAALEVEGARIAVPRRPAGPDAAEWPLAY